MERNDNETLSYIYIHFPACNFRIKSWNVEKDWSSLLHRTEKKTYLFPLLLQFLLLIGDNISRGLRNYLVYYY